MGGREENVQMNIFEPPEEDNNKNQPKQESQNGQLHYKV